MHARRRRNDAGFTLAETLVTIGLTTMLFATYFAILSGVIFLRRAQYDVQAAAFLQEELESLRIAPFTSLTTRTDGNFLNVPVQRGGWTVQTVGGHQAMKLATAQTAVVEETGLMIVPGNAKEDFTFSAEVRIDSSSPAGWGGGLVFGYRDAENHYRFRYRSGGMALDKVVNGVRTTIWSQNVSLSTDTWYTLEVVATSNSFVLKRNGVTLTTQGDGTFPSGDLGIIALNSAQMAFDTVSVTEGSTTSSRDFNADTVGSVPTDWVRRSYKDLPTGTGTLTISDYQGDATIKSATAKITWRDGLFTRSRTAATLIAD